MSKIKDSVILITGAANGIGRELAQQASSVGCKELILLDIDNQGLQKLKQELVCECTTLTIDLSTDIEENKELVEIFETKEIDLLILNAGLGGLNPGDSFNEKINKKIFYVNVFGTTSLVSLYLPKALKRRKGHIVGVASLAGLRGMPQASSYSASKAAQISFLESIRLDLRPYQIKVTTILPGFIKTRMTNHQDFKMPFMVSVEKTASKILRSIEKNKKVSYFPFPMNFLSLLNRMFPAFIYDPLITMLNPPTKKKAKIF